MSEHFLLNRLLSLKRLPDHLDEKVKGRDEKWLIKGPYEVKTLPRRNEMRRKGRYPPREQWRGPMSAEKISMEKRCTHRGQGSPGALEHTPPISCLLCFIEFSSGGEREKPTKQLA